MNGILYGTNEYSETQGGDNQWWRVDLGNLHSIKLIELYSRNEQCKNQVCIYTVRSNWKGWCGQRVW